MLELVAALTILATGIVGVMSVTNSSIGVATTTSARSKAVALATHKIEEFRARPYDALEVKPACAPPAVPVPPAPPASPTCYPMERHTVGGRSYVVESAVAMTSTQSGVPLPNAYKAAYVIVSWEDATHHEVRQETIVYPGGRGPYSPVTTTTVQAPGGSPSPPTGVVATETLLASIIGIDLDWTAPASSNPAVTGYVVQYSTDNFATTTYEATTFTVETHYRVTDLSPGTTYYFRVRSVAANGNRSSESNTVSVTTSANPLTACQVGVVSVTPSAAYKAGGDQGSKLKSGNPAIAVNTTGNCLLTVLVAYYSPNATTNLTAALTRSGSIYTGILDGNQNWDVGMHEIVIKDGLGAVRAVTHLLVCESSKKVCAL